MAEDLYLRAVKYAQDNGKLSEDELESFCKISDRTDKITEWNHESKKPTKKQLMAYSKEELKLSKKKMKYVKDAPKLPVLTTVERDSLKFSIHSLIYNSDLGNTQILLEDGWR